MNKASGPRRPRALRFAALRRKKIETVTGYWLNGDDFSFERWDLSPGTLHVYPRNKSIRFSVRPVGPGTIDPFEVVIRDTDKGWVLKADGWEEAETEYPLQVFESHHSVLFVFSGKTDQIYLHVDTAGEKRAARLT